MESVGKKLREARTCQGKTLEQVIAAKPSADLDATWGKGFINGDMATTMIFQGLGAKP